MTYDTTFNMPAADGAAPISVPPPPSFGSQWHSSVHKATVLLPAQAAPTWPWSSEQLFRGAKGIETLTWNSADTCDASAIGSGNAYQATSDRSLRLQYLGSSRTSSRILSDAEELVEETYTAGSISSSAYVLGGGLSYNYTATATPGGTATSSLLTSISDNFGRTVSFSYEQTDAFTAPRIHSMTAPDGAVTTFGYDAHENLTSINWPDSAVRTFRYELSAIPWAMTGITDELNRNYSIYGYDTSGRATSTELAGHTSAFSVNYATPPSWVVTTFATGNGTLCQDQHWAAPQGTSVTSPNGHTSALVAATTNGFSRLASATTPAGSGSVASAIQYTYDVNGNPLGRDDLNGNRTCYSYDTTRDLQTAALEGLAGGVAGKACPSSLSGYAPSTSDPAHPERLTTTVWHPNWALKAREAGPMKITTWVYNGQLDPVAGGTSNCVSPATTLPDGKPLGVLCTLYEQATSDATGALGLSAPIVGATRAWTYTYNQYGQVLTQTTPKQSPTDALSHTTTYAYYPTTTFSGAAGHTMGDLNTVTNPLGQVTTYTSYDKAGRLLSNKDANSTVTSMTYWPRGWVHTVTVTSANGTSMTTTYDYWPTGLLKTVTMPDASTLNYAYDDAHRLTDVIDGAGNKIHYALDGSGNRISEQVSDASGQLANAVSRVYDQLNRVQASTGMAH